MLTKFILYNLNFYRALCQLYLKTGKKMISIWLDVNISSCYLFYFHIIFLCSFSSALFWIGFFYTCKYIPLLSSPSVLATPLCFCGCHLPCPRCYFKCCPQAYNIYTQHILVCLQTISYHFTGSVRSFQ